MSDLDDRLAEIVKTYFGSRPKPPPCDWLLTDEQLAEITKFYQKGYLPKAIAARTGIPTDRICKFIYGAGARANREAGR